LAKTQWFFESQTFDKSFGGFLNLLKFPFVPTLFV